MAEQAAWISHALEVGLIPSQVDKGVGTQIADTAMKTHGIEPQANIPNIKTSSEEGINALKKK